MQPAAPRSARSPDEDPGRPRHSPLEHAVAHVGVVALLVLGYAGVAALLGLPHLRAATALAATIGLGSALVASLQRRRTIAVVWSELTVWIGVTFWVASLWNALFAAPIALLAVDLALGLGVLLLGFQVTREARRLPHA